MYTLSTLNALSFLRDIGFIAKPERRRSLPSGSITSFASFIPGFNCESINGIITISPESFIMDTSNNVFMLFNYTIIC